MIANTIKNIMASQLLNAAIDFYKDPKNVKAFEKWKNSKEGKKYANNNNS